MRQKVKNFIAILNIELDDLIADINFLIERTRRRHDKGEITNYVFYENQVVFKNELNAINNFKKILARINPEDYNDIPSLMERLRQDFAIAVQKYGYAKAAILYAERKLRKVEKYCCGSVQSESA